VVNNTVEHVVITGINSNLQDLVLSEISHMLDLL